MASHLPADAAALSYVVYGGALVALLLVVAVVAAVGILLVRTVRSDGRRGSDDAEQPRVPDAANHHPEPPAGRDEEMS